MNIKVAIADRDESYLDRLGEGLQRYKHLTCTRYSDPETFQRALLSRTFDVVLFDVSILSEKGDSIPDLSNVTLPIFLYHGDTEIGILPSYIEKIDKYQRVSGIYRRMTQLLHQHTSSMEQGERAALIAVYSPAGGTGKTVISWKLGKQLADGGKKVLYLSLEDVPAADAFVKNGGQSGMDMVFPFARKAQEDIGSKMDGCMQEVFPNLYYLAPFSDLEDGMEVSEEEWGDFLVKLSAVGNVQYIILDMESGLSPRNRMLLLLADYIVLVEKPDPCTQAKMKRFLGQRALLEDYSYKMVRVQNFDIGNDTLWSDCGIAVAGRFPFFSAMGRADMLRFIERFPQLDTGFLI